MTLQPFNLEEILKKAVQEVYLTDEELEFLLSLSEPEDLKRLFSTAQKLRFKYFSNKIFLYGFVYFSTYCRNDCNFCLYRRSNTSFKRYRKSEKEILSIAQGLASDGVHLLDLTMGEDPIYHADYGKGFESLISTVDKVKQATGLPLMISPGVVSNEVLRSFKEVGVDWFACYQETHNEKLYGQLRVGQSYDERMAVKHSARQLGLLIEEGLMVGVGDSDADIVKSLNVMKILNADQVRVMSFVPQPKTPMAEIAPISRIKELVIIAVMRIVFPNRLIPASLDVDGLKGLSLRLDAGANVITSIIPPQAGLAGVSQNLLDIEEGNRNVSAVIPILTKHGLEIASSSEYASWVLSKKKANVLS